jgi:TPR repeat protein
MFALGAIHAGGHEVTTDRQAAQRWFRAAAELGHGHAQLMVGRYLVAGTAGELNPEEGCSWLERAAGQGVADAEAELSSLTGNAATEVLH